MICVMNIKKKTTMMNNALLMKRQKLSMAILFT